MGTASDILYTRFPFLKKGGGLFFTMLLCCLFSFSVTAQINYVLNPSLETYDTCPNSYDQIKFAKYWSGIDSNEYWGNPTSDDGLPEYINTCAPYSCCSGVSAPVNDRFYHFPHTGNGMAQVLMFFYHYPQGLGYTRDYLQGRLSRPLTAGKHYCVTFYASQEQQSSYSIKQIGAYLDDGHIDTAHYPGAPQTLYTPQVLSTSFVCDTLHWVKIEGSFTANGTEKFITIGNFFDNLHTDTATFNANSFIGVEGTYLIDDISVIESDHVAFAGHDTSIYKGDSILLGEIAVPYTWYKDSTGLRLIDSTSGGIWIKPDTTTTYIVKQTLCGVVSWDTVVVSVMPVGVKNVGSKKKVVVYPNPIQNELTIENAENCIIHIFDVVGREVYSGVVNQNKDLINTNYFSRGTYFLEITSSDGERMIKKIVKE